MPDRYFTSRFCCLSFFVLSLRFKLAFCVSIFCSDLSFRFVSSLLRRIFLFFNASTSLCIRSAVSEQQYCRIERERERERKRERERERERETGWESVKQKESVTKLDTALFLRPTFSTSVSLQIIRSYSFFCFAVFSLSADLLVLALFCITLSCRIMGNTLCLLTRRAYWTRSERAREREKERERERKRLCLLRQRENGKLESTAAAAMAAASFSSFFFRSNSLNNNWFVSTGAEWQKTFSIREREKKLADWFFDCSFVSVTTKQTEEESIRPIFLLQPWQVSSRFDSVFLFFVFVSFYFRDRVNRSGPSDKKRESLFCSAEL